MLSRGDADRYRDLVAKSECTPEQQAGDGTKCPSCGLNSRHVYTRECMNDKCKEWYAR